MFRAGVVLIACMATATAGADTGAIRQTKGSFDDKFRQLSSDLPAPSPERAASGAPGPDYWQQRADYRIKATLDEDGRGIVGQETITYHNRSPHTLEYLWLQLEQNRFAEGSLARRSETASRSGTRREAPSDGDSLTFGALRRQHALADTDYGFRIGSVTDGRNPLSHTIVDTSMRIDLPVPLRPGESRRIDIEWSFRLIEEEAVGGRSGYEELGDGNAIFFVAQWFPRMAAYTDYGGWHNKAFLGRGEFTLEFGDYDVTLTVPADHIVSATGVLLNANEVLDPTRRERLARARRSDEPVFVVTPEEAENVRANSSSATRSWRFRARNVRDFAWASSRKFIWDAMSHDQKDGPPVTIMSFYPPKAAPLWSRYASRSVQHALEVYSRFTFPYPYPTAQAVNTWEGGGMEYPMITFNGYRPEPADDEVDVVTWSRRAKAGLIGVIVHEIGHIYFPMIVNSDERQWTWMDEGLNTFLEYVAEQEWEQDFPAFREFDNIHDYIPRYMRSSEQVPVMTQADSILNPGPNAYFKPTAALSTLRETVMGPELFDHAFRTYARRWQFRRPTPADFFRTMEDASGIDLDWFWRGWFYSTDHVDVAIADVREYTIDSGDPDQDQAVARELRRVRTREPYASRFSRDQGVELFVDRYPELRDFYNEHDRFTVSNADRNDAIARREALTSWEREALDRAGRDGHMVYFVDFENIGGLVTPLPLRIEYDDGSVEDLLLPAEIWRRDPNRVTRLLIRDRSVVAIGIDPDHRLPDTNRSDNDFPRRILPDRLELDWKDYPERNLMRDSMLPLDAAPGSDDEGR